MDKPFSLACERNQDAILQVLQTELASAKKVFEIGTGTGQHAVYFSKHLDYLIWQTSDREENHPGIHLWLEEVSHSNVLKPIVFDVNVNGLDCNVFDAVFTANTFHIMSWAEVCLCIQKIGRALKQNGKLIIYGPFNINEKYTSSSNQAFDEYLKSQDRKMGIRNFESVREQCQLVNLAFLKSYSMPANNFILVFSKE